MGQNAWGLDGITNSPDGLTVADGVVIGAGALAAHYEVCIRDKLGR